MPAEPRFTPQDWYWTVAGSTTQVYSSKSGDYVPVTDAGYLAWQAAGNAPSVMDTEANMGEVLTRYSLRPVAANVLDGYTSAQATKLTIEVVAKVLFNHENRIRTLAAQPSVTAAQFLTFLKGLM